MGVFSLFLIFFSFSSELAKQHAALVAFAKDPAQFVHCLARSNARDVDYLQACAALDAENPLDNNPYVNDAVAQYLLQKRLKADETSKKK